MIYLNKTVKTTIVVLIVVLYFTVAFGSLIVRLGSPIAGNHIAIHQLDDSDVSYVNNQVWQERQNIRDIVGGLVVMISMASLILSWKKSDAKE